MAYYRVTTIAQDGASSDYSDALTSKFEDDWTSVRVQRHTLSLTVAGGARTVDLSDFTTVESITVNNQSTANYVTATVTNAASASVAQRVPFGETLKLTDATAAGDLTLTPDTTTQTVEVIVAGS